MDPANEEAPYKRKLESSNLLHTVHTACQPTLQHHNSHNRTDKYMQGKAVWPPEDGRKDARKMLRKID